IEEFNRTSKRTIDRIADDALRAMLNYSWPGNIRELRNVVEYAFAIGEGPTLTVEELTPELRHEGPIAANGRVHLALPHGTDERERIVHALTLSEGRRDKAAELLGISRSTLWRKMREHNLS